MRQLPLRSRLLVLAAAGSLVLLGCGSATPGGQGGQGVPSGPSGDVQVTDEPESTDLDVCDESTLDPEATDEDGEPYGDPCFGGPGGGGDDESSVPSLEGEWTGTLTYNWTQRVEETGPGMHSLQEQTYHATVQITSTQVDIKAWELTGTALVTASWTSEFSSQLDTPLGPCNQHYTDSVPPNSPMQVDVSGGLEVGDPGDLYQLSVGLTGFELTNHTVRDDTGCFGSSTVEDTPWPVAPTTLGDSGTVTDPTHLTGTLVKPNSTGDDTLTYDLRLN